MSDFISILQTHRLQLSAIILVMLLSACDVAGFKIYTAFSNTQDIQPGTPVLFEDAVIGEVSDVELLDNGARVELRLDKEAAKSIGSSSAVVVNRLKQGAPLEIYNRNTPDQAKLENGQSVKGLDSMFQLGAWMLGDAIQVGSGAVSELVDSFQGYLQSQQFQQDKEQVQEQLSSVKKAAQEAIKDVEGELATAANEIEASEDAAARAVDELGEELAPVVEELSRSGAQLAEQLEKFTQRLAHTDPGEQQAGEQFLASLLAMLEKLNQSIERGSEQKNHQDQEKD